MDSRAWMPGTHGAPGRLNSSTLSSPSRRPNGDTVEYDHLRRALLVPEASLRRGHAGQSEESEATAWWCPRGTFRMGQGHCSHAPAHPRILCSARGFHKRRIQTSGYLPTALGTHFHFLEKSWAAKINRNKNKITVPPNGRQKTQDSLFSSNARRLSHSKLPAPASPGSPIP